MNYNMKKILIASLAAAAMLFAGCNKNVEAPANGSRIVRVSASADPTTMVASSTSGRFTWQKNDAIGIWTGAGITKFTLDPEWDGFGYGEFVGELPEGGVINENSYAIYPYDEINLEGATATSCSFNEYSNWGIPQVAVRLYAKGNPTIADGKVANYAFHHCNAYFRVTLKNVRAEAGCVFIESNKQFLPKVSTIDFSGETPSVSVTATNDWTHFVFPDHTGKIESLTFVVPIAPAVWDSNFKFAVKLYSGTNFGGNLYQNNFGWFTTPTFQPGDYYIFPEITYPNAKATDDSGTGVNDGIEEGNVVDQGDSFWTVG